MFKKNSSWLVVSGVAVVAIFAVVVFSQNSSSEDTADSTGAPELTFSEEKWDIGDVSMADGDNVKEIIATNIGDAPVIISEMLTSCMCTSIQIVHADGSKSRKKGMPGHGESSRMSEKIQPGEEVILRIVFDPNAHGPEATGPISRKVILRTADAPNEDKVLSFFGNVIK